MSCRSVITNSCTSLPGTSPVRSADVDGHQSTHRANANPLNSCGGVEGAGSTPVGNLTPPIARSIIAGLDGRHLPTVALLLAHAELERPVGGTFPDTDTCESCGATADLHTVHDAQGEEAILCARCLDGDPEPPDWRGQLATLAADVGYRQIGGSWSICEEQPAEDCTVDTEPEARRLYRQTLSITASVLGRERLALQLYGYLDEVQDVLMWRHPCPEMDSLLTVEDLAVAHSEDTPEHWLAEAVRCLQRAVTPGLRADPLEMVDLGREALVRACRFADRDELMQGRAA